MRRTYRLSFIGSHAAAVAVSARGLSILAAFALNVMVARALPVTEVGGYYTALAFVTLAATVGRYGLDNLAMRQLAGIPDGANYFRSFQRATLTTSLAAVPVTAVVGLALHSVTPNSFQIRTLLLMTLSLPGLALSVLNGALLRATGRVALGAVVELGAVPTIVVVCLAVVGSHVDDATDVACLYAAASVAIGVLSTFYLRSGPNRGGRGLNLLKSSGLQLRRYMGTSVLFLALTWAPILILATVASPKDVAGFTVANRIVGFLLLVPAIQTAYLAPKFAHHHREGRPHAVGALARRATAISLAVGAPAIVLFEVAPQVPLLLFGSDFVLASAAPLRVLSLGALLVLASGQVNPLLLTCGQERAALRLNMLLLSATVIGALVAGGPYGAVGVAVVTATALGLYSVAATIWLAKAEGISASVVGVGK